MIFLDFDVILADSSCECFNVTSQVFEEKYSDMKDLFYIFMQNRGITDHMKMIQTL